MLLHKTAPTDFGMSEAREAGQMSRDAGADDRNPAWGDGRAVVRRPEARDSDVAKANVIRTAADAAALSRTLVASVRRRRAMTDDKMQAQLDELAKRAARPSRFA
jgi:hypothetical protein